MYENIENALYRNLGKHMVNLNKFHRYKNGKGLTQREMIMLLGTLRHYRNTQGLHSSIKLKELLKNLESNLVKRSRNQLRPLRERILLGKMSLKRRYKAPYKKVPFTALNLQSVQLRKTPKRSLANLALLAVKNKSKIPLHMLTPNQIKLLKSPPSLENLKMASTVRKYIKLLKEYSSRGNNMNENNVKNKLNNFGVNLGLNRNNNYQHEAFERLMRSVLFEQRLKEGGTLRGIQERYKRKQNLEIKNIKKILKLAKGQFANRLRSRTASSPRR